MREGKYGCLHLTLVHKKPLSLTNNLDDLPRKLNGSYLTQLMKQLLWNLVNRRLIFFANKCNAKCKKYVSWLPDLDAYSIDAFTLKWHGIFFYVFPPFCTSKQSITKDKKQKCYRHCCSSTMALTTMRSTPLTQKSHTDCRHIIRRAFLRRGISPCSVDIMLASLSTKTRKQYESALNQWILLCIDHDVDPLQDHSSGFNGHDLWSCRS